MKLKFSPRKYKKMEAAKRVEDTEWKKREGEVIVRDGDSDAFASVVEPNETTGLEGEE